MGFFWGGRVLGEGVYVKAIVIFVFKFFYVYRGEVKFTFIFSFISELYLKSHFLLFVTLLVFHM